MGHKGKRRKGERPPSAIAEWMGTGDNRFLFWALVTGPLAVVVMVMAYKLIFSGER